MSLSTTGTGMAISSPLLMAISTRDIVTCASISPDGATVCGGAMDHMLHVWDTTTGAELTTLNGHTDMVTSVAFSHDSSFIISGSYDNTVRIWNVEAGSEFATLSGHTNQVDFVAFFAGDSRVIYGSLSGTMHVWDLMTGKELATLNLNQPMSSNFWTDLLCNSRIPRLQTPLRVYIARPVWQMGSWETSLGLDFDDLRRRVGACLYYSQHDSKYPASDTSDSEAPLRPARGSWTRVFWRRGGPWRYPAPPFRFMTDDRYTLTRGSAIAR